MLDRTINVSPFEDIVYDTRANAERAISKLRIYGPQIEKIGTAHTRVGHKLMIFWKDGRVSFVTRPLFTALTSRRGLTFWK